MNSYIIKIILRRRRNGTTRYYRLRAERHLFPTLIRHWGESGTRNPFSLITTFRSVDELDHALRYLISQKLDAGYRVSGGRKWLDVVMRPSMKGTGMSQVG